MHIYEKSKKNVAVGPVLVCKCVRYLRNLLSAVLRSRIIFPQGANWLIRGVFVISGVVVAAAAAGVQISTICSYRTCIYFRLNGKHSFHKSKNITFCFLVLALATCRCPFNILSDHIDWLFQFNFENFKLCFFSSLILDRLIFRLFYRSIWFPFEKLLFFLLLNIIFNNKWSSIELPAWHTKNEGNQLLSLVFCFYRVSCVWIVCCVPMTLSIVRAVLFAIRYRTDRQRTILDYGFNAIGEWVSWQTHVFQLDLPVQPLFKVALLVSFNSSLFLCMALKYQTIQFNLCVWAQNAYIAPYPHTVHSHVCTTTFMCMWHVKDVCTLICGW